MSKEREIKMGLLDMLMEMLSKEEGSRFLPKEKEATLIVATPTEDEEEDEPAMMADDDDDDEGEDEEMCTKGKKKTLQDFLANL